MSIMHGGYAHHNGQWIDMDCPNCQKEEQERQERLKQAVAGKVTVDVTNDFDVMVAMFNRSKVVYEEGQEMTTRADGSPPLRTHLITIPAVAVTFAFDQSGKLRLVYRDE